MLPKSAKSAEPVFGANPRPLQSAAIARCRAWISGLSRLEVMKITTVAARTTANATAATNRGTLSATATRVYELT